jgi:hypothetical protein
LARRDRSRSPGRKGKGKGKANPCSDASLMIYVKPGRFKSYTINVEANDTVDDVN